MQHEAAFSTNTYSRLNWAQTFAHFNRDEMMDRMLHELSYHMYGEAGHERELERARINCHHNFTQVERHFGRDVWVTRKGAVSAKEGELGIIPGSMGTRSYIVRGKGNPESFSTCSHGAGRVMSRGVARKTITLEQHAADTAHVVCRKDADVLDESPRAYKDIDQVMAAQDDLVDVVHVLRQVVCVKG